MFFNTKKLKKPVPEGNEILIKVRAASVNPLDRGELKGVPYIFRIMFGLRKPEVTRPGRPGVDLAGQVEAVGRNVTQFEPGDACVSVILGIRVSKFGSTSKGRLPSMCALPSRHWF